MTTTLQSLISAVVSYAVASFKASQSINELRDKAVQAYCEITSYEDLKAVNKAFNNAYYQAAEAAGLDITEKSIRDKCTAAVQYLRRQAKYAGWQQPENPNSGKNKPLKDCQVSDIVMSKKVSDAHGNTVVAKVFIPEEKQRELISLVVERLPKSVFLSLFNRDGSLKSSLLRSSEGSIVSEDTKEAVEKEVKAILSTLTDKLGE